MAFKSVRAWTDADQKIQAIKCNCPKGWSRAVLTDDDGNTWAACVVEVVTVVDGKETKETRAEVHGSHEPGPAQRKTMKQLRADHAARMEAEAKQATADAAEKAKHVAALRSGKPGADTFAYLAGWLERQG